MVGGHQDLDCMVASSFVDVQCMVRGKVGHTSMCVNGHADRPPVNTRQTQSRIISSMWS